MMSREREGIVCPRSRSRLFGLRLTLFGLVTAVAFPEIGDSFRVIALDFWYFEITGNREGARLVLLLASVLPPLFPRARRRRGCRSI